ncbi:hypothetical protein NN761_05345 [Bacteroides clarus]|uniref:hypothetical protein n=1 Tax=Bacteroides clarus TaxID=626929 RepID=UPI002101A2D6|nr:hypothetical protein [Bacteroides clarus]MCQ1544992.1 hypothetical protein [Bacteroides clarus]
MKKLIYTNENRLKLQIGYNEDWAKAVNFATKELKKVCEELTDEQITKFLSSPSALCNELVEAARKEYDAYMANLPKSVRLSTAFSNGGISDAVKVIHKTLMAKKTHQIIDKTTIKDGVCLLDKDGLEALKTECSVYGGEQAEKVWKLSVKAAKALNELQSAIEGNNAFADAVECWGRWQGFITINDNKTEHYKPNPNILNTLSGEKE